MGLQMTISENALNCKPEFAHWDSYSRFARYVSTVNRYILNEEQRTFLDTVLATIKGRDGELKEGHDVRPLPEAAIPGGKWPRCKRCH